MGFSDISLQGSDKAANLLWKVENAPLCGVDILREHFYENNGIWNTPGYINVALVLVDSGLELSDQPGYYDLIDDALSGLAEALDAIAEDKNSEIYSDLQRLTDGLLAIKERNEAP